MQLQYFMALEIARERVREAEARARLRWGVEPETSLGRRIAARLPASPGSSVERH